MSRPQGKRPPSRQTSAGARPPARQATSRTAQPMRRTERPRSVPPRRGPSPILIGGLIGLVLGLLLVAYLLGTNNRSTANTPSNGSTTSQTVATDVQTQPTANAADAPPRLPLLDFKALYDDPAKRPVIIDVRAKDAYDAGHIKGAISFPQSDVATRVQELPKDKLIVAYCQ